MSDAIHFKPKVIRQIDGNGNVLKEIDENGNVTIHVKPKGGVIEVKPKVAVIKPEE